MLTLAGAASAFTAASWFRDGGSDAGDGASHPRPPMRATVDTARTVALEPNADAGCTHLGFVHPVRPSAAGCEECLKTGDRWVHLRVCMTCGHVGCCDSSPNKHATKHFHAAGHPVMRSAEPGETWGWCYVDEVLL